MSDDVTIRDCGDHHEIVGGHLDGTRASVVAGATLALVIVGRGPNSRLELKRDRGVPRAELFEYLRLNRHAIDMLLADEEARA